MAQNNGHQNNMPLIRPEQIDGLDVLTPEQKTHYKNGMHGLWRLLEAAPQGSQQAVDVQNKIRDASQKIMATISNHLRPNAGAVQQGGQPQRPGSRSMQQPGIAQQGGQQKVQPQQQQQPQQQAAVQPGQNGQHARGPNLSGPATAELKAVEFAYPLHILQQGKAAMEPYRQDWYKRAWSALAKKDQAMLKGANLQTQMKANQITKQSFTEQIEKAKEELNSARIAWENLKKQNEQVAQLQRQQAQQAGKQQGQEAQRSGMVQGVTNQQGDMKINVDQATAASPKQSQGQFQQQQVVGQGAPAVQHQQQGIQQQAPAPMQQQTPQQTPQQAATQPQFQQNFQQHNTMQNPQQQQNMAQQRQPVNAQQMNNPQQKQQPPPQQQQQMMIQQQHHHQQQQQQNVGNQNANHQQIPQQHRPQLQHQQQPQRPQALTQQAALSQADVNRGQAQHPQPQQQQQQFQQQQQQQHNQAQHHQMPQPPDDLPHQQNSGPASATQSTPTSSYPTMTHNNQQPSINTKFPIPKTYPVNPQTQSPVPMDPARPTYSNAGMLNQVGMQKNPQFTLEGDGDRVLSKRKLDELVRQVTGSTSSPSAADGTNTPQLSPEVEECVLSLADDFVDNVVTAACRLAKLRPNATLELRDVQIILERNYGIRVPGYGMDEVRTVRKFQPAPGWQSKMQAVQAAKVMGVVNNGES